MLRADQFFLIAKFEGGLNKLNFNIFDNNDNLLLDSNTIRELLVGKEYVIVMKDGLYDAVFKSVYVAMDYINGCVDDAKRLIYTGSGQRITVTSPCVA